MRVLYFKDADSRYSELREGAVVETRDIDESTLVEMADQGRMVAIAIQHLRDRAELLNFVNERGEACTDGGSTAYAAGAQ